jgi:hypothetical protein
MAYPENIENGSLFFMLSTADLNWYDLKSYMPRLDEYEAADEARHHQIASQNLNENPHISAYWLYRHFNLFEKYVLMDLFDGIDFWFWYEWQM